MITHRGDVVDRLLVIEDLIKNSLASPINDEIFEAPVMSLTCTAFGVNIDPQFDGTSGESQLLGGTADCVRETTTV